VRKFVQKASQKAGQAPGTLVHVGERKHSVPQISVWDYDAQRLEERETTTVDECVVFAERPTVTWMNVSGIHDIELLRRIGECYGIHPLALEDVLDTDQRPKIEDYGDYFFVVLKMLYPNGDAPDEIIAEQVSLVVGNNFVISFQEDHSDVFGSVRERIRHDKGRLRKEGADYLAYSLIDAIVDQYFVILERLGERVEDVEEEMVTSPGIETIRNIHELRTEMLFLRRSVWPLREVAAAMARAESPLIRAGTVVYLRDLYDHTIQVIDTIETLRDMISGMLDIYLSSISNRMNEVMKVLTIIATIFIPLTFVVGLYGMNFKHMPELQSPWGYPAVLLGMAIIAGGMLAHFRRRGWI
jgi:magnesium transporter